MGIQEADFGRSEKHSDRRAGYTAIRLERVVS
jgi:hypothetical protein